MMTKYNIKRRHSKTLDLSTGIKYRPLSRSFASGGILDYNGKEKGLGWNKASKDTLKSSFSDMENTLSNIGSVVGGVTSIADSAMKNAQIADTTGIESNINEVKTADFDNYTDTDSLIDFYNNQLALKSDYTGKDLRGLSVGEGIGNTLSAVGSGASAGASVGGPWGAVAGAAIGLGSSIAGIFTGKRKAENKAEELNRLALNAEKVANMNFQNQLSEIQDIQHYNNMANLSAYGGDLNTKGGYFSNGIIKIDEGGTHEQNPFEGVPMGVAPDGQPNLVEEGEVIFKDYVFSNRLHLTDEELKEANLPKKYRGYTFALAAEDLSKESSERPNDPISRRGLENSLGKLSMIQEQQRMKKGKKGTQQMMAFGGRKYRGDLDIPGADVTGKARQMPTIVDTKAYADFIGRVQDDRRIRDFLASVPEMESEENINALDEAFQKEALSNLPEINIPLSERTVTTPGSGTTSKKPLSTASRYAPIVGSAIGALSSVLEKPDYTNSDLILDAANNLSRDRVSSRPINNYLTYKPLDRNYYLSKLQGQAGATRAALRNSGSNPGQVMAGLLAADYNAQNAVGDTLMKMDMYNEQQRQAVEQFNRGTNQYNSQATMNADAQNAQLASMRDKMRLAGITTAAGMREATDTALANSKSMNLTNFFDNLGAVGQENFIMNQIASNPSLYYNYVNGKGTVGHKNKRGGMLTRRNRRRR